MTDITPEQAREWRDDARPGPWYVHTDPDDPDGTLIYDDTGHMCIAVEPAGSDYREADLTLAAAAPDLAQTVIEQGSQIERLQKATTAAGMEWEWGVQHGTTVVCLDYYGTEEEESGRIRWTPSQTRAKAWKRTMEGYFPGETYRLVRRLVGPLEVVE